MTKQVTKRKDDKIKLADWYGWSDKKLAYENEQFALRCAESMRSRLKCQAKE